MSAAAAALRSRVWTRLAVLAGAATVTAGAAAAPWAAAVGLPRPGPLALVPIAACLAAAAVVVTQTGLRVRPLRGILRRRGGGERVPASAAAVADLLAAPRRLARGTVLAAALGAALGVALDPAATAPGTVALGMAQVGLALLALPPTMLAWRASLGRLLAPFEPEEVPIPAVESLPRWAAALSAPAVGGAGLLALATAVAVGPPRPLVLVGSAAGIALGLVAALAAARRAAHPAESAELAALAERFAAADAPEAAALAAADLGTPVARALADRAGVLAARYETSARGEAETRLHLEALQRRKTRFVAAMSHDLRSPLNAILGFADLLASGAEGPLRPAQRESLAAIQRSGGELLDLLGEVLDAARVDAGRLPLHRAWTPSVEILTEAVAVARRGVAGRVVEVEATLQPGLPPVLVDRERIVQAVVCLFRQAARAAERGPLGLFAGVAERPDGGREVRVDVVDERGLIPGVERERLLAALRRVRERAPLEGPLGLSLSLAWSLARAHGGDVTVEPGATGGTTFSVRLPVEPLGPDGPTGAAGSGRPGEPADRGRATS